MTDYGCREWKGWKYAVYLLCALTGVLAVACMSTSLPALPPAALPPLTLTLWLATTGTTLPVLIPMTATPAPLPLFSRTPVAEVLLATDDTPDPVSTPDARHPDSIDSGTNSDTELTPLQAASRVSLWLVPDPSIEPPDPLPTLVPRTLTLMPPTCYDTASDVLECLGYVVNDLSEPVGRVAALIELRTADGQLLASQVAQVEQYQIPPGGRAPYRARFTGIQTTTLQPGTVLIIALQSADPASPLLSTGLPIVQDELYHHDRQLYQVTARLVNAGQEDFHAIRVVVTLFDADERVTGYRVLDPGGLAAGDSTLIAIDLYPGYGAEPVWHTLYVEAWHEG